MIDAKKLPPETPAELGDHQLDGVVGGSGPWGEGGPPWGKDGPIKVPTK